MGYSNDNASYPAIPIKSTITDVAVYLPPVILLSLVSRLILLLEPALVWPCGLVMNTSGVLSFGGGIFLLDLSHCILFDVAVDIDGFSDDDQIIGITLRNTVIVDQDLSQSPVASLSSSGILRSSGLRVGLCLGDLRRANTEAIRRWIHGNVGVAIGFFSNELQGQLAQRTHLVLDAVFELMNVDVGMKME
ncbi:uncharacterized protein N7477_006122 [Penicillium maclennaniae]|uniref:uncharacterized protein n=1 Tax=Penicillium maclennaniae TaxID=1343394 RepID=UPI00254081C1|nr:uncharacterized protein N7477_006122 [Penicillium maclennaniae]KAJ5670759.1 hypothetical protein N7477_006122 [Penicillium maclennaniae]